MSDKNLPVLVTLPNGEKEQLYVEGSYHLFTNYPCLTLWQEKDNNLDVYCGIDDGEPEDYGEYIIKVSPYLSDTILQELIEQDVLETEKDGLHKLTDKVISTFFN